MFNTQVQRSMSGQEQRNVNWDIALGKWELGERDVLQPQMDVITAFFRARKGKAVGFRFKDWADYSAGPAQGTLQSVHGLANAFQLFKVYTSTTGATDVRKITKPVEGAVKVYRAGSAAVLAGTVDYTTGIVVLNSTPAERLFWVGEFDVPVRFDTDELRTRFVAYDPATHQKVFQVLSLPVTELRL